ncbi:MAG: hypothetical protein QM757_25270 [Paludibaculum sp.]
MREIALHSIYTPPIALLDVPVGIQAPQKTVAGIRRFGVLLIVACVFDLSNAGAAGPDLKTAIALVAVFHVVFGVENDSNDLLLQDAHEGLDVVTVAFDHFGVDHVRGVDLLVAVHILQDRHGVGYLCLRHEDRAYPIVDETGSQPARTFGVIGHDLRSGETR